MSLHKATVESIHWLSLIFFIVIFITSIVSIVYSKRNKNNPNKNDSHVLLSLTITNTVLLSILFIPFFIWMKKYIYL